MRKVFITGGTGTIGRELVAAFSSGNYEVLFQYHEQSAQATQLSAVTGASAVSCDLASQFEISQLKIDDVDVLINNAGVNICRAMSAEVSASDWDRTLAVNLTAPFFLVRQVLPGMMDRKWGRIINISSIYGLRASEENLPYTVSKHGLGGLTKTVAREYGEFGITSNEICPGPVDSELLNRIAKHYEGEDEERLREYYQSLADSIPSKRLALPADIASTILFMASEGASYINGVSLPVDGGLIA